MEIAESPGIDPPPRRRRLPAMGRARTILLVLGGVALTALIGVWVARKPIASGVINRALAERGVAARYTISNLGLGRQRLTNVAIGDAAHPDLVADWVELNTSVGLTGPSVIGVRAGQVRVRGRLVDGKLSLGAIDRLLPASTGGPFMLPKLRVDVADARMRLETQGGVVGLKLAGAGQLNDGFSGRLAALSERLMVGGCVADRVAAVVSIRIDRAKPILTGPVRAGAISCGDTRLIGAVVTLEAILGAALDRWSGRADMAIGSATMVAGKVSQIAGTVSFDGGAARTAGRVDLRSGAFTATQVSGATLSLAGSYRFGAALAFAGTVRAQRAALSPAVLRQIRGMVAQSAGTPVGPLAVQAGEALRRAGQSLSLSATVAGGSKGRGGAASITQADLRSASGAHLSFAGDGLSYEWPAAATRVAGRLTMGGGGLPEGGVDLRQAAAGAPVTGTATFQPYAAPGARLALAPMRFRATSHGDTVFGTRVTLSGPLGDGRVDGVSLAAVGTWNGRQRIVLNPACSVLSFDRVAVSGLVLDPARLRLCPVDGALLRIDGSRLAGATRIDGARLGGRLGDTPVTLAVAGARAGLSDRRFAATGVKVAIGAAERRTLLEFASLDGAMSARGLAGRFVGGGGQIANVPLLMSGAAGDWTFVAGRLALTGALTVADAAAAPRFAPLAGHEVKLALVDGVITGSGTLVTPGEGVKVAEVALAHDLGRGTGHADLRVPGITFSKGFQPDRLTRLTYGVIADVDGMVAGDGHIVWTPQGVTSSGAFRTAGIDLAAAFGPVTGISGEVRFTDLLNMVTAPGQVASVATVNPGIPVENGTIRYRLLAGNRIQVEGGTWPFAGGELVLDPTILDFSETAERRMTFRVTGLDAQQFLQQFDFKNLDATGRFDGVLPMIFDQQGGRIEGGHLTVREGGGTIAYVGEISQKDVGLWGNLAFQALKALRYRSVDIVMNGPLAGEMVTEVRFAGVSQGEGTSSNFVIRRLAKLPFVFNVRIQAPFRGLIDSAKSFYDPSLLIQRNLPALLRERDRVKNLAKPAPIQPPESEKLP